MSLYRDFVVWAGYAGYVVAEYEIELRAANKGLRRVSDDYTVLLRAKTVAETKALVAQRPEYRAAEDEVERVENVKLLATSIYMDLENSGKTVSRELTRRTSRSSLEERNDRYNA